MPNVIPQRGAVYPSQGSMIAVNSGSVYPPQTILISVGGILWGVSNPIQWGAANSITWS